MIDEGDDVEVLACRLAQRRPLECRSDGSDCSARSSSGAPPPAARRRARPLARSPRYLRGPTAVHPLGSSSWIRVQRRDHFRRHVTASRRPVDSQPRRRSRRYGKALRRRAPDAAGVGVGRTARVAEAAATSRASRRLAVLTREASEQLLRYERARSRRPREPRFVGEEPVGGKLYSYVARRTPSAPEPPSTPPFPLACDPDASRAERGERRGVGVASPTLSTSHRREIGTFAALLPRTQRFSAAQTVRTPPNTSHMVGNCIVPHSRPARPPPQTPRELRQDSA